MKLVEVMKLMEEDEREKAELEKIRGQKIQLGQKQKDLTRQKKMYKGNPNQRAQLGKQISTIQGKKSDLTIQALKNKQTLDMKKKARKVQ